MKGRGARRRSRPRIRADKLAAAPASLRRPADVRSVFKNPTLNAREFEYFPERPHHPSWGGLILSTIGRSSDAECRRSGRRDANGPGRCSASIRPRVLAEARVPSDEDPEKLARGGVIGEAATDLSADEMVFELSVRRRPHRPG